MFKTFRLRRLLVEAQRHALECGNEALAANRAIIAARKRCIRAVQEHPHGSDASTLAHEIFEVLHERKPTQ